MSPREFEGIPELGHGEPIVEVAEAVEDGVDLLGEIDEIIGDAYEPPVAQERVKRLPIDLEL